MTAKKKATKVRPGDREAGEFMDELLGGPLTFGAMVRSTRLTDNFTLATFAKKLGVSRQFVCDVEQGRRSVSAATAAKWASLLGYSEAVWIGLALQDGIDASGLKYRVHVTPGFDFNRSTGRGPKGLRKALEIMRASKRGRPRQLEATK